MIREAKKRIAVIDNYIDDSVLVQLSKRTPGITVDIYDGKISRQLRQDVEKHNLQYPGVTLHRYDHAHDRFLIIDETVYHIGASLKDLGKNSLVLPGWASLQALICSIKSAIPGHRNYIKITRNQPYFGFVSSSLKFSLIYLKKSTPNIFDNFISSAVSTLSRRNILYTLTLTMFNSRASHEGLLP